MSTARLELVVTSSGIQSADKDLKQLTATSKETEKQQQHMADVFAEVAAAEEKEAKKAIAAANAKADAQEKAAKRAADEAEKAVKKAADLANKEAARQAKQLARENEQWNDAKQRALARYEKEAEAAERAAARKLAAAEKAAKREDELWNNAIQRAKAGLDGVLPIRPSLQRIEARLNTMPAGSADSAASALLNGGSAAALQSLSGLAAPAAAAAVAYSTLHKVISETSAYDGLIARLAGVTGGTEAAREQFDKLEALSDKTIFTENAVTEAFIRMEQNGLKPTEQTLSAFANIASATGSSIEQLAEVSLAASLGNYKGLRQFGIKAVEEGDRLKVTFKGVSTVIGTSAEEITKYLVGIGENDFAGAAERQLDTMGGAVKKLEDSWGDLFREVGRSAVGEFIAVGMREAASAIDATTKAFEALLYTASQRPQFTGMSAELAAFAKGASKWGAPQSDEELSLVDKTQLVIEQLEKGRMSAADKALQAYLERKRVLEEALTSGVSGDIGAALDENQRQYEAAVNASNKAPKEAKKPSIGLIDVDNRLAELNQRALNTRLDQIADEGARELEQAKEALTKTEDAEKASYEKRKQVFAKYTGADAAELLAANEVLYQKHLDELDTKSAQKQLELQKRLQNIGIGPQSQYDTVNRKYAGQQYELGSALSENMSGKNGISLQLEAEETYAQKSIEIERARAREIAQINAELSQQSLQNASMIFGGLASAMKNAHGEQSKEYRMMFAAQKAFGIATAEAAMFIDMAKANEAGFPANVPLYLKAAADGMQIISQLSSLSYSGAYDVGGTIPGGSYGDVGERRPELLLVHGRSQVQGPATVIGGAATASLLGGSSAPQSLRIVNAYDGGEAVRGFLGSTQGEQVLVNFVKRHGSLIRSVASR